MGQGGEFPRGKSALGLLTQRLRKPVCVAYHDYGNAVADLEHSHTKVATATANDGLDGQSPLLLPLLKEMVEVMQEKVEDKQKLVDMQQEKVEDKCTVLLNLKEHERMKEVLIDGKKAGNMTNHNTLYKQI